MSYIFSVTLKCFPKRVCLFKVFLATIIGSVVGVLDVMAFYANLPYAQAPGMGRLFTFTVVFGMAILVSLAGSGIIHRLLPDKCS